MSHITMRQESKDYVFDLAGNQPTPESGQGCVLFVLSATPEGIRFRVGEPFGE